MESRDVEFIENKFNCNSEYFSEPNQIQVSDSNPGSFFNSDKRVATDLPIEPRKSQRVKKEKNFSPDFISFQAIVLLVEGDRNKVLNKILIVLNTEEDPKCFNKAMSSRDAAFWKEAVNDEIDSILSNNTWVLVDLPPGSKPIGCKWVFRRKYDTDRSIQTFKARLVAKGFRQKEGINYFDTYAPVARITFIRVLLALASLYNLYMHQNGCKNCILKW